MPLGIDTTVPREDLVMAIHSRNSLAKIREGIEGLTNFDVASMSGRSGTAFHWTSLGRLPHPYREQFSTLDRAGLIDYVVMSYYTPIAWHTASGTWIVPRVTYSATTTNHQSIVRRNVDTVSMDAA